MSWLALAGLGFSALSGLWIAASALMAGGEILHEIKGLREDVSELKVGVNSDRIENKKMMDQLMADQRKVERRLDVLWTDRFGKLQGYKE